MCQTLFPMLALFWRNLSLNGSLQTINDLVNSQLSPTRVAPRSFSDGSCLCLWRTAQAGADSLLPGCALCKGFQDGPCSLPVGGLEYLWGTIRERTTMTPGPEQIRGFGARDELRNTCRGTFPRALLYSDHRKTHITNPCCSQQ